MSHSDDDGLVLPPAVAPHQIIILPIFRNAEEERLVLEYCENLKKTLVQQLFKENKLRVHIDKRDMRGGEKNWQWVKKGIPLRIEIGPRDIAQGTIMVARRDRAPQDKISMSQSELMAQCVSFLEQIQDGLLKKAQAHYANHIKNIHSLEEFEAFFGKEDNEQAQAPGFARCFIADKMEIADILKKYRVTQRCIPLNNNEYGRCIFTGQENAPIMLLAKAY
ncbi:hypothetical protein EBS02_07295 [bacterium]|nr:hypothetical protein [bacterium]